MVLVTCDERLSVSSDHILQWVAGCKAPRGAASLSWLSLGCARGNCGVLQQVWLVISTALGFHGTLQNAPTLQYRQCLFGLMLCLALNSRLKATLLLAQASSFNAPSGSDLNYYYYRVDYPFLVIISLFYVGI